MEAVLLIGLQAAGKSTFCMQRFFATHIRINLDMLKTRHRELILLNACLEAKQPFVIDNTNPTLEDRKKYIEAARPAGFRIVGYYFAPDLEGSLSRNSGRTGKARVPDAAVYATLGKMRVPAFEEGFDALFVVRPSDSGGFEVVPVEGLDFEKQTP